MDFDKRSRLQIYEDLKKKDINSVVKVEPSFYIKNFQKESIFPLSGVSLSKTIYCNENGFFSIYKSDRFGFNNPDNEWNADSIEYFIIGDSFAHGACVNRPNDIASVLRSLNQKNALTLGYNGNATLIEYATLKEYLMPNVKNIIWLYYENDLEGLAEELKSKKLIQYLEGKDFSQNLKEKQNYINFVAKKAIKFSIDNEKKRKLKKKLNIEIDKKEEKKFIYNFFKFLKLYNTRYYLFIKKKDIKKNMPITEFKKIMANVKKLARLNNSELLFIYLPSYESFFFNYKDSNKKIIEKIISKNINIKYLDITKVFKKKDNPFELFPFQKKGHYNEKGYRIVAEEIFNYLN